MLLNVKHPDFSLSMELLCMLSRMPLPLSQIAEDLEIPTQRDLRGLVSHLRIQGHDIDTIRDPISGKGFMACIGKTWRDRSFQQQAEAYFEKVYPRQIGD